MRSEAKSVVESTSGKANVWSGDCMSTMQDGFRPPRETSLGNWCEWKCSTQEARHDGLNANSSSREGDDSDGLEYDATTSEGAKRRYEAHFVSKLTDCDGEANETDTSLDFAFDCGYIAAIEHRELAALNTEVCSMLGSMIKNPTPFLIS